MDLSTLAASLLPISVLIYWLMGAAKDVTNFNLNGIVTRVVAVGAAFGSVALYAHSAIDLGGSSHDVIAALSWHDQLLAA